MSPRAIRRAWLSSDGSTGARNYDEFAQTADAVSAIQARPDSMLSVDLPEHEPAFADVAGDQAALLARAAERLGSLKSRGLLQPLDDVVVAYEIDGEEGRQLGAAVLVSTDAVWDAAGNPHGKVIRNEAVFPDKLVGRIAHLQALRHFVSSVLLLAGDPDRSYRALVQEAIDTLPVQATDVDQRGNRHRLWAVPPGDLQRRVLACLARRELVVADGNHRSLAAQESGVGQFLAVVMAAETMRILPYHRLVASLGMEQDAFVRRLRQAGYSIAERSGDLLVPDGPGQVGLRLRGRTLELTTPPPLRDDPVSRLDHQQLESLVIRGILGLSAADHLVRYVGGDHDSGYLQEEVESGACEAAFAMAAVRVSDFMEVNRLRLRMPVKSTWFQPKIRAGLVVAEVR